MRRLRAAWRAAGQAGLEALTPQRGVEPTLMRFFAVQAEQWLVRELPRARWSCVSDGHRIRVAGGRQDYELRFVPDRCRWLLISGHGHVPALPEPCWALTDCLRHLRRCESRRLSNH